MKMLQKLSKSFYMWIFLPVTIVLFFSYSRATAGFIKIRDVIQDTKVYDNQEITIQGEVIGDIMKRRNGHWLNIDDGSECIGIWTQKSLMPEINFIGNYKATGDTLQIRGIFNRACPDHAGETDIHALDIKIIRSGYPTRHPIIYKKLHWMILLFVLAMLITGIYWWQKAENKKGIQ